jgi:hypothetical protein
MSDDGDARTATTAQVGVLVGALAPIVILLSPWPALGFAATLAFLLVALGAGITCWVDAGDAFAQAALTLALSLGVFALAATLMIWLAAWDPNALLLLAVPSVLSCTRRLRKAHLASSIVRSTR